MTLKHLALTTGLLLSTAAYADDTATLGKQWQQIVVSDANWVTLSEQLVRAGAEKREWCEGAICAIKIRKEWSDGVALMTVAYDKTNKIVEKTACVIILNTMPCVDWLTGKKATLHWIEKTKKWVLE